MCGICGFNGEFSLNAIYLKMMLMDNERRGKDATGYAYHNIKEDNFTYHKMGIRARDFIAENLSRVLNFPTDNMIGHTRNLTKGPASVNDNNHPHISNRYIVVHNGCISNDDELEDEYDLKDKRKGIVDSSVIPWVFDEEGVKGGCGKLQGSFALGIIDKMYPETLILARNYSYTLFVGKKNKGLLFSSEEECLKMVGCTDTKAVENNQILFINNGEIVKEETFTPSYKTYNNTTYSGYTGWNVNDDYYDRLNKNVIPFREKTFCGITNREKAVLDKLKLDVVQLVNKPHVYDKNKYTYVTLDEFMLSQDLMDYDADKEIDNENSKDESSEDNEERTEVQTRQEDAEASERFGALVPIP